MPGGSGFRGVVWLVGLLKEDLPLVFQPVMLIFGGVSLAKTWELTYPLPAGSFEDDDFPFSQVG